MEKLSKETECWAQTLNLLSLRSFQTDVVDLSYFKLWILLDQIVLVGNIKYLHYQVANMKGLDNFLRFLVLKKCFCKWSLSFNYVLKHSHVTGGRVISIKFYLTNSNIDINKLTRIQCRKIAHYLLNKLNYSYFPKLRIDLKIKKT